MEIFKGLADYIPPVIAQQTAKIGTTLMGGFGGLYFWHAKEASSLRAYIEAEEAMTTEGGRSLTRLNTLDLYKKIEKVGFIVGGVLVAHGYGKELGDVVTCVREKGFQCPVDAVKNIWQWVGEQASTVLRRT